MPHVEDKVDQVERGFQQSDGRQALLDWVHGYVDSWEQDRDTTYKARWEQIRQKWNCDDGKGAPSDSGFKRSRLVSPALQQAVEDGAAELEEVVLGKQGWFDVEDDILEQNHEKWQMIRGLMEFDMEDADVPGALLQCFFLGSLYGTMIGKLTVEEQDDGPIVGLEPVLPWQFVIDTGVNKAGKAGIREALGMAHRLPQPKHRIRGMQNDEITDEDGNVLVEATYWDVPLETQEEASDITQHGTRPWYMAEGDGGRHALSAETVLVTEYHGLVPLKLFEAALDDDAEAPEEMDTREMVEAIVTYVNDEYLLSVRPNTNKLSMRGFVASPWDIVPGSFWGRGVGEKALPAQKVLDIFLRGQVDAMRYHVYPIMAVNMNRVASRTKLMWGPGQEVRVQGNPQDAFFPVQMPSAGVGSFQMDAILQQHVTQATGITPDAGRGEKTLGGMSAIRGGFLKRMNRTIRLISKNFLAPFIDLYYSTQCELNPREYGEPDLSFRVFTAAGLVAREAENQTLAELIQFIPPQTPGFWAILSEIVKNTSAQDKGAVMEALAASLQAMQQPDPDAEVESVRKVEDLREVVARRHNKQANTMKILSEIERGDSGRANPNGNSEKRSSSGRPSRKA